MFGIPETLIKVKAKNIYEWMVLNIHELSDAIKEDGCLGGPKSGPMLSEMSYHYAGGRLRQRAKALLKSKLLLMGLAHLLPVDTEEEITS